jgi:hypothetical protein
MVISPMRAPFVARRPCFSAVPTFACLPVKLWLESNRSGAERTRPQTGHRPIERYSAEPDSGRKIHPGELTSSFRVFI